MVDLVKLQKALYRQWKRESEELLVQQPSEIRKYHSEFEKDFSKKSPGDFKKKADLIADVRSHRVTFIADFHTFQQAQRTALRILRSSVKPGENWAIGLELVPSKHQNVLDDFIAGKIQADEFRKRINYNESWGFPWENYSPLFEWAKTHRISMIALNRPSEFANLLKESDLKERDRWAAGILTDRLAEDPDLKIVVLYGELHVATSHLPTELKTVSQKYWKKQSIKSDLPDSIVIHQNHDRTFWKLAESPSKSEILKTTNILLLRKGVYCVFSAPPWAKLSSWLNWIEHDQVLIQGPQARSPDTDDEDEWEPETDLLSLIQQISDTIFKTIELPSPGFESLTFRNLGQADLVADHLRSADLTAFERSHFESLFRLGKDFYLAKTGLVFYRTPSLNLLSEVSALLLWRRQNRTYDIAIQSDEDFCREVLMQAFGFWGSLLLNPNRKCDFLKDLRKRKKESEMIRASIRILEKEKLWEDEVGFSFLKKSKRSKPIPPKQRLEPAKLIGRIIGHRCYQAFVEENLDISEIRRLLLTSRAGYRDRLVEIAMKAKTRKINQSKADLI
ncbi:MAG: ChaN family lipoprotein [Bdellovibrionales bacterium]|nr:ChaN family lipoprotein [Bdellovibrionales bacterium]